MKNILLLLLIISNVSIASARKSLEETKDSLSEKLNVKELEQKLSQKLPLRDEIAVRLILGEYYTHYDMKKSLSFAKSVFQPAKRIMGFDTIYAKESIVNASLVSAYMYMSMGKIEEAMAKGYLALETAESINFKIGIARTYSILALIEDSQSNTSKMIELNYKALQYIPVNDSSRLKYQTYNNLGYGYIKMKKADSAFKYISLAYNYAVKNDLEILIAFDLYNFGNIFLIKNQNDSALVKYKLAEKRAIELNDIRLQNFVFSSLGEVYRNLNKLDSSVYYYNKSIKLSTGNSQIDFARDAYLGLHQTYVKLDKYQDALLAYKDYIIFRDSVNSKEALVASGRIEAKYDFEKKSAVKDLEYKVEIEKQNKSRNIAIGTGLMLLIIVGGLYNRNKTIQKSKKIIEKERDRSDNLLLNILPAEIANELKEKGISEARDFELVTILFTDFKEFTQASEKLTAKELVEEINVCFKEFDNICNKYQIEKIKTIGDSYMAAGGLPVQFDESVKNTVLAALEMNQFILDRKNQLEAMGKQPFEMRLGIHSGPVVAGIVGVKKFQYDIWGDTVNTASRMESTGEIGKVNISNFTYNQIQNDPDFQFEYRGKVEAKGKGDIDMYFVSLS